jgi:predicted HicB family RNase H-like nuclease
MVNINITVPDDLHRRLRIAAAEQGISQKDLIIAYLEDYAKHTKG